MNQQARPQSNAVNTKVFNAITAPAVSAVLPNFGQAMHILTVTFPGAALVSGIQVRLEASFDNVLWFPIGPDITQVAPLAGIVYTTSVAYVPYPYLRVRSIKTAPLPMTLFYTGMAQPIGPTIPSTQTDRVIL